MSIFTFFFFNDTATTEIYTLSLHDALPIYQLNVLASGYLDGSVVVPAGDRVAGTTTRSEEHTSELQSPLHLVCRLLLDKKKKYVTCLNCYVDNLARFASLTSPIHFL